MTVDHRDSYLDVPGGTVFARTWGSREGIPIVLLHDSLGSVELWRKFPETLQKPVIAYDRLGFGRSSPLTGVPSADFIREEAEIRFPALLKALGITDYILFGHSVGGAMALSIASADPGRCRAVITESAQAFVEDRTLEGITKASRRFRDPDQFAKLERSHGRKAEWVLRAWTDVWLSPEFADWSLEPILSEVKCPVLAIHGDEDEFGSVAFPQMIVGGVAGPAEIFIMQGVGHVPHRERPDQVTEAIKKFLKSRKIR